MSRSLAFAAPQMIHLIWLVPAAALLLLLAERWARRTLVRLSALHEALAPVDGWRRRLRGWLFLAALLMVAVAATRPGWNAETVTVHQEGRDVVFAVDVSRSMLAQDLVPSRLERAKLAILDTMSALDGDRVGVVAFAGTATVVCPLTRDYGFFRWAVEGLSPGITQRGGSLVGDAIRKVSEDVFDPMERRYKDLILISDGEDQGSFPVEAAAAAGQQGVRIIAVGLGDEARGSRIPVTEASGATSYLTDGGREVWSRLRADTLRALALATPGGRYLNVATGAFDLGQIYRQLVTGEAGRDLGPAQITVYQEQFQLFLLAALLLLIAEMLLADTRLFNRGSQS